MKFKESLDGILFWVLAQKAVPIRKRQVCVRLPSKGFRAQWICVRNRAQKDWSLVR